MKAPVIPCDWEDVEPDLPPYPPQTLEDYKNFLVIKTTETNNSWPNLGSQAARKIDTNILQVFRDAPPLNSVNS